MIVCVVCGSGSGGVCFVLNRNIYSLGLEAHILSSYIHRYNVLHVYFSICTFITFTLAENHIGGS